MKTNKKTRLLSIMLGLCAVAILSLNAIFATDVKDPSTIDTSRKGSITLYKYEQAGEVENDEMTGSGLPDQNTPDGAKPLAGVEFTLYKVTNTTLIPTEAQIDESWSTSETTGEDGKIVFPNLDQGLYLVRETKSPANVSEPTPDFLVNIPMTVTVTVDGEKVDQWLYDVTVYPKNQTIYGSAILNKIDEESNPLQGAQFQLYVYDSESKMITTLYSEETFTTDVHGQIAVTGLPKGHYAFVETKAPEGYGLDPTPHVFEITASGEVETTDNGYVAVPIDDTGKTNVQIVTVHNTHTPVIDKGVKTIDNKHAGYNKDQTPLWVIETSIPSNIESYKKYIIRDTIDERLDLIQDSIVVNIGETTLIADTDYKLTYDESSRLLKIIFIDESFDSGKAALITGKDNKVHIEFNTKINEKAQLGQEIPNQADIDYNNGYKEETKQSSTPEVHTGGLSLYKYTINSGADVALAGAEFKLAASEADAKAGTFIKDKDGNDIVAISGEDGVAKFEGIAYGEDGVPNDQASTNYWLVETKSPEVNGVKYNLLDKPIQVTINKDSHAIPATFTGHADFKVSVLNKTGIKLPTTGGMGTILFTVLGAILMVSAIILFTKSSKKEKVMKIK